jgi:hypothetical protein
MAPAKSGSITSEADCWRAAVELKGATHLIYAALYEAAVALLLEAWNSGRSLPRKPPRRP